MEQPVARLNVKLPQEAAGKSVYLRPDTGAVETLCFLRDVPCGIITARTTFWAGSTARCFSPKRRKRARNSRLRSNAMRDTIARARSPMKITAADEPAEGAFSHVFRGVDVLVLDEAVHAMCFDLMTVLEAADLPADNFLRRRGARGAG